MWTNLCTQNSGPEWITSFTKTTEQLRDDTHFVPSDSSVPDCIRPYLGQSKGDQITFYCLSLQPGLEVLTNDDLQSGEEGGS